MKRFSDGLPNVFVSLLIVITVLGLSSPTSASLRKPTYAAGDRWVYVLNAALSALPGLNASQNVSFRFGLVGLVEMDVIGPSVVVSGNASVPTMRVDTRSSGFLNGTFSLPGGLGSARVTGTFSTSASEFWEDQSYLPIESHGTTTYVADVTSIIPIHFVAEFRVITNTSVSPIPPFDLDVGQNATARLGTHLDVNSTVTFLGRTMSSENATYVSSTWRREVLAQENVTVEAGTFAAYRLNQTLTSFPGIPVGSAGRGNETADFSNVVGLYVKRVAYENGTRVAEMRLKSYAYGAPLGLSDSDVLEFVLAPVAVVYFVALALASRRNAQIRARMSPAPSTSSRREGGDHGRAR